MTTYGEIIVAMPKYAETIVAMPIREQQKHEVINILVTYKNGERYRVETKIISNDEEAKFVQLFNPDTKNPSDLELTNSMTKITESHQYILLRYCGEILCSRNSIKNGSVNQYTQIWDMCEDVKWQQVFVSSECCICLTEKTTHSFSCGCHCMCSSCNRKIISAAREKGLIPQCPICRKISDGKYAEIFIRSSDPSKESNRCTLFNNNCSIKFVKNLCSELYNVHITKIEAYNNKSFIIIKDDQIVRDCTNVTIVIRV